MEKVLNHGNIEKLFEYDTNGRLTSSVIGGAAKAYSYDNYGNPTSIGGLTTTWERGTLLKSFSEYVSYSYNHKGVRFAKTNGQRSINYYLDGTKILGEDHNDGKRIRYFYDITGLAGFTLNEVKYHYVKDLQGNIVRIHNASGQLVCKYYYDAWGNTTIHDENGNVITNNLANADHIAIINPFRYRSYYYDNETGYYYLQTRYYDPNIGRFISPDTIDYLDPTDVNGLDLYCYCVNNPVTYYDPTGHSWESFWKGLMIVGSALAIVAGAILIATGAGAILGGALVGFGIGSLAGGFYNESQGNSFAAGWAIGGALGGAAGALIAWATPTITGFLSSSWTIGGGMALAGGGVAGGLTITGTQIAAGVVGLSILFFAKGSGPRMGHNQHERQQWDEAMRKLKIEDKDLQKRIHSKLRKYPYSDTLEKLLDTIKKILKNFSR